MRHEQAIKAVPNIVRLLLALPSLVRTYGEVEVGPVQGSGAAASDSYSPGLSG